MLKRLIVVCQPTNSRDASQLTERGRINGLQTSQVVLQGVLQLVAQGVLQDVDEVVGQLPPTHGWLADTTAVLNKTAIAKNLLKV